MKKIILIAVVFCMAFMVAAPAMATEFTAKGYLWERFTYTDHEDLRDNASSSFWSMKWRIEPTFKISDNLTLQMRIDALDNKNWGDTDLPDDPSGNNIDFDRAWMTIKTGIGGFLIGRMAGNTFGTSFADSVGERDRVVWVIPIENFTAAFVLEKYAEGDKGTAASDKDTDKYFLTGTYKSEALEAGLLYGYINDKSVSRQSTIIHEFIPYVIGNFGPVNFKAEFLYANGVTDDDDAGDPDTDINAYGYMAQVGFNAEAFGAHVGYAFITGDTNFGDNDMESGAALQDGGDWANLFYMTNNDSGVKIGPAQPALAPFGLDGTASGFLVEGGSSGNIAALSGWSLIYGGVDFAAGDKLKLALVAGVATADDPMTGWEDDFGMEVDVTANLSIYDNLSLKCIFAYLNAGDFWQGGNPTTDVEDTYTIFTQLTLKY